MTVNTYCLRKITVQSVGLEHCVCELYDICHMIYFVPSSWRRRFSQECPSCNLKLTLWWWWWWWQTNFMNNKCVLVSDARKSIAIEAAASKLCTHLTPLTTESGLDSQFEEGHLEVSDVLIGWAVGNTIRSYILRMYYIAHTHTHSSSSHGRQRELVWVLI